VRKTIANEIELSDGVKISFGLQEVPDNDESFLRIDVHKKGGLDKSMTKSPEIEKEIRKVIIRQEEPFYLCAFRSVQ